MTSEIFLNKLALRMEDKPQTLTLKLDLTTHAEFSVAAKIFRARSVASFLHQYVVGQISEAKKLVTPEEFERMVEDQKEATLARSRRKAAEKQRNGTENEPLVPVTFKRSEIEKMSPEAQSIDEVLPARKKKAL
jgi:hypothetical protein